MADPLGSAVARKYGSSLGENISLVLVALVMATACMDTAVSIQRMLCLGHGMQEAFVLGCMLPSAHGGPPEIATRTHLLAAVAQVRPTATQVHLQ